MGAEMAFRFVHATTTENVPSMELRDDDVDGREAIVTAIFSYRAYQHHCEASARARSSDEGEAA